MSSTQAVRGRIRGRAAVPPQPRNWSHSRLSLYARCPLSYRFRYVDRVGGKPSAAATRGKQVHEFAEAYAHHCHRVGRATDYDAARELLAGYDDPDVREIGLRFMETTQFDWSLIVADGNSVEREFAVELPDDLGIFRGRVDLVQWNEFEGALVVTDYKSGWSWSKPDECPTQLECYAWAMMQCFPAATSVQAIYRYLANGRTYDWMLYDPRPDWACGVARRVLADARFEPTPSPQACAYCDYCHLCPLVQEDPLTCLTSAEDAAQALRQVTATEARLDELRAAVRAWTHEYGEVRAAGKVAREAPPLWHIKGEEYQLREGVTRKQAEAKLLAAGWSKEDVASLWPVPDFDTKAAGKLVKVAREDEDPFGYDETDPRLAALLEIVEPRPWDGKTRFRIDDVKADEGGE